ncbi:MAG: hypothetical protein IKD74_02995 [Clostridia bacterium]|nr:hypothetical protein [Clostridia bacterium]
MKDIEDRLKEEYDKVEVPDYMFDTSRVFRRTEKEKNDSKKKIVSIAASVIATLLIAIALIFTIPNLLKEEEVIIEEKGTINNDIKGEVTAIDNIANLNSDNIVSIAIISIKQISDYKIINNVPYSIVKAQVLNRYLGDLADEIEMYVPGGIFTAKDIKEKVKYNKIDDLSKYSDEDLLKVTYYNEIYIPMVEENKTYITTINKVDGKYFINMNVKLGFKEYNTETNMVTINNYDEQLDIDRYLESINI